MLEGAAPDDALAKWLDSLPNGKACSLFCEDVNGGLLALTEATAQASPARTVVMLEWSSLPRLTEELGRATAALAEAALTLYPWLYASARQRQLDARLAATDDEVETASRAVPGVAAGAARRIVASCRARKIPNLRGLPRAEQVRQLALAIDPKNLVLHLAVLAREWSEGSLLSFARGAEWLAANARARAVLVLPAALAGHAAFDAVTYRSRHLTARLPAMDKMPGPKRPVAGHGPGPAPQVSVSPVLGKPHPGCEPEQRLHRRISEDHELAPLFRYNQVVRTTVGVTPRVDLLWPEGRLVVEVDGYPLHSRRQQFFADRERDFRLLVSGYRVWRIDDNEILHDTERVVEKLRQLVRLLRKESQ